MYYDQGFCHYYLGIKEDKRENEVEAIEQWRQAEKFLVKALEINMEKRGALALDTIDNQEYLSDAHLAMSRWFYKRAVAGLVRAKAMAESLTGEDSDRTEAIGEKIRRAGIF